LSNLGVALDDVRGRVELIIGRGDRIVLGEVGLTPRAKKVIELAVDEARRLNHHYIGTEHLLLGLVREGEGIASQVLEMLGGNLERVRIQTIRVLGPSAQTTAGAARDVAGETSGGGTSMHRPSPLLVPPPLFRDLLRVIAIGEREQHDGVTLTAVALEVYADGCLLTLLVQRIRAEPEPRGRVARLAEITATMTDDHDHVYVGHVQASSGVARPDSWEGRALYACTPTLDPVAEAVRIEIPQIAWHYTGATTQAE